jgi:hypothetical protein
MRASQLYFSPNIITMIKSRRMRWADHVSRMGETRNAYRILVESLYGNYNSEDLVRRWKDNIKMEMRKIGC